MKWIVTSHLNHYAYRYDSAAGRWHRRLRGEHASAARWAGLLGLWLGERLWRASDRVAHIPPALRFHADRREQGRDAVP